MLPELLARFIVCGLVVLVAAEGLVAAGDNDMRTLPLRFKWSLAWYGLRYTLIVATLILCALTMENR